jgi:succinoglycan biosynthesis transport protein ExoP
VAQEAARAVRQLEVQMRQAQASEVELQARMNQLASARSGESRLMPRLQQLLSEADAAQSVYDAFIQGLFRAGSQNGVPTAKGRIIQHAEIVAAPTFPNIPISMAVVFGTALMTAIGVAFALEGADRSFHSAGKLEEKIHIPVLGITLMSAGHAFRFIRRPQPLSRRVVTEPTSVLSESVRLVGTAIAKSRSGLAPQVVMVTSAAPAEGKTVFALMLARQSAQSGKRVIAIEGEMRKPKFGRELYPLPQKGLTEYLTGDATLDEITGVDNASGVHFIAVRKRSRFASELLASREMAALMQELREKYDLIVIDTPPASIVADALQLGALIDTAVLVVKWGATPQHLVADAVHKLRVSNVPLAGAVLTQVNPKRYRFYGEGALAYEYAKGYYAA